tara:strand:- start:1507 stop:2517 length:1011 start_codon:yes stop_codon:yes gene_type:complete
LKKTLLITGAAGFIGFSLAKKLKSKFSLILIDNFNDYYDVELKKSRAKILKNFGLQVKNIDICNKKKLTNIFKKNRINYIVHLAAQAGVRYSIEEPDIYIKSNILGTFNILECIKNKNIEHLLIASTSSIYGNRKKNSFKESDKADEQVSLYAATKKSCEVLSHSYSQLYKINTTVFRFFTVYGPWGRPDMALFKFTQAILSNKKIDVYNYGKNTRDFTYIDDLIKAISLLVKKIPSNPNKIKNDSISKVAPYRVVNIGNKKAVSVDLLISTLEKVIGKKSIKNLISSQRGDVVHTLANTKLLKSLINFEPNTDLKSGVKKFYEWYLEYFNIKNKK